MKRIFGVLAVLLLAFALVACKKTPVEDKDFEITFSGVDNVLITAGDAFNVLAGVKATGTDGVDYTSHIKVATANASISEDGTLRTDAVLNAVVKYSIELESPEYYTEILRTVTIKAPEKPTDEMIANGNFAEGMLYWDTFLGDGGNATFTQDGENGLKIDVTSVGVNRAWEPRLTQMGVPFEKGKAYKISFEAKALAPKTINLQVGEIIANDPWFIDFKPGIAVHKVVGTEWATISFEFIMTLENDRGGVLFEFGQVGEDVTTTTLWLRNVKAEEVTLGADETAPVITTRDLTLLVGAEFKPEMLLVSIQDDRDGAIDLASATVEIKKGEEVVAEVDSSVPGEYQLTFTAKDKAGNEATATATVKFDDMVFKPENVVKNGEFTTDITDWGTWFADWDGTAVTFAHELVETNGVMKVDVTSAGGEDWSVQLFQEGLGLMIGKTYQVSFKLKASVARTFGFEVVDGINSSAPVPILTKVSPSATTEWQEYSYLFTVNKTPELGKIVFMLGKGEAAVWEIDDVKIVEADLPEYIVNSQFDATHGWRLFTNNWEGTVGTLTAVDNEFVITLTKRVGGDGWHLQFIQDMQSFTKEESGNGVPSIPLEASKTYVLSFDIQGDQEYAITALVSPGVPAWVNLLPAESASVTVTTEKVKKTIEFTTPAEFEGSVVVKFEFGAGIPAFESGERVLKFANLSIKEKDLVDAKELVVNGNAQVHGFVFENASGDTHGSFKKTAEGLEITTTSMGDQPYIPHVFQGDIQLDAGKYVYRVLLKSSVARTIRTNLTVPAEGYRSILPDTKYDIVIGAEQIGEFVEVIVRFELAAPVAGVKLEFDFGPIAEGDAAGVFVISELMLYREFN